MSQTGLTALNARLAALNLPPQTEASLAALPVGLTLTRIEHALGQAEGGQPVAGMRSAGLATRASKSEAGWVGIRPSCL